SKMPVDVSMGVAAAGVAIDFMGRFQSEMSTPPGREPVMGYVNPEGGSSINADPVALLRGAPSRELAVRFIEFVLGEGGQRLWNYRAGTPGGPRRFALRRLPIRRDFYPSPGDLASDAAAAARREFFSDPLWQPDTDAYRLAEAFHYEPRWTAAHFGIQRDLVRCMCMDSAEELKAAWGAILRNGGPGANPEAMRHFEALPDTPLPLTWESAVNGYAKIPRMDILREWTAFFRRQYRLAEKAANKI
ncbi:MAG: iron ABC transporter substrate-binding protein, partial [Kiritimatiellaeota bacterium]|nr:iron ABC transporter substrate-binding protein [Kiritimatiellota bacterium]